MKKHFVTAEQILRPCIDLAKRIKLSDANFSAHFGLKRIGVHYQKLSPAHRTSLPHSESEEEEFVFVISGAVDLWLNGWVKTMRTGDCIGFPSGTGVGHTIINNSAEEAELFVVGERTKGDNLFRYHLAPELAGTHKACWWHDMPEQTLGGHSGLPGEEGAASRDESIEIFNGPGSQSAGSFSYPGDDETFGDGVCLSRRFGLKNIAVWLERLPPGKRSAWPHAHSVEEEFVYILEGAASIWLDGEVVKATPGEGIDFISGSGVAHAIINSSTSDVHYLCVGECDAKDDKIFYPLHPVRNDEMKKKGQYWDPTT